MRSCMPEPSLESRACHRPNGPSKLARSFLSEEGWGGFGSAGDFDGSHQYDAPTELADIPPPHRMKGP